MARGVAGHSLRRRKRQLEDGGPPVEPVWLKSRPLAFIENVRTLGGIAAPLLAGFSLTAVIQLVTLGKDASPPRFAPAAVSAFAIAAGFLLYALQFSAIAVTFGVEPSQYLDFFPEARRDPESLRRVREMQFEDTILRWKYNTRAHVTYDIGLIAFLLGLGLTLVPSRWSPLPYGRVVALAVVGAALVIEAVWIFSVGRSRGPEPLLPSPVKPEEARNAIDAGLVKTPSRFNPGKGQELIDSSPDLAQQLKRLADILSRLEQLHH